MKLGELFVALGFDVDNKKLEGFNADLNTTLGRMGKITLAGAAALFAINKFVSGSVAAAAEIRNFGNETGRSEEILKKWQVVAQLTNVKTTAEDVTSSFRGMAAAIAAIEEGNGPSGAFARLGVTDVRGKSIDEILTTMRDYINTANHNLSDGQIKELLNATGVGDGLFQALRTTNEEFEKLSKNRYMTNEQVTVLNNLGLANKSMRVEFNLLKDTISAGIAPEIERTTEGFAALFGIMRIGLQDFEAFKVGFNKVFAPAPLKALQFARKKAGELLADKDLVKVGGDLIGGISAIDSRVSPAEASNGDLSPIGTQSVVFRGRGNSNVSVSNTWHITGGGEDPEGLADLILEREERIYSSTLDEQDNGSRF